MGLEDKMNNREVMQQALEALRVANDALGHPDNIAIMESAIRALRAALAEQCHCGDRPAAECPGEWEPGCDLGANEAHVKVHEPQEPVAWLSPRTVDSYPRPDLGYETCSKTDYGAFPVYTHPAPQRQPLTEEDVNEVIAGCYGYSADFEFHQCLARAIERAHGIGGQDE